MWSHVTRWQPLVLCNILCLYDQEQVKKALISYCPPIVNLPNTSFANFSKFLCTNDTGRVPKSFPVITCLGVNHLLLIWLSFPRGEESGRRLCYKGIQYLIGTRTALRAMLCLIIVRHLLLQTGHRVLSSSGFTNMVYYTQED